MRRVIANPDGNYAAFFGAALEQARHTAERPIFDLLLSLRLNFLPLFSQMLVAAQMHCPCR